MNVKVEKCVFCHLFSLAPTVQVTINPSLYKFLLKSQKYCN